MMATVVRDGRKSDSYLMDALALAREIEAWPLVLDTLLNVANARVGESGGELSREVLTLVRDHLASERQTSVRAQELLARLDEEPLGEHIKMPHHLTGSRTLTEILDLLLNESMQ